MQDKINEISSMRGPRDTIFDFILSSFKNQPVRIFQIGAIETLDNPLFKIGSGWSDIIFGKYIKKHGGKLTVADISLDHLANSKLLADYIGYNIQLQYGDGLQFIDDSYDIYYLDGSIDPKETSKQFDKVFNYQHKNKLYIIVDDFSIKGQSLNRQMFKIYDIEKGLGVYFNGK